jgi:hypothetical protein
MISAERQMGVGNYLHGRVNFTWNFIEGYVKSISAGTFGMEVTVDD